MYWRAEDLLNIYICGIQSDPLTLLLIYITLQCLSEEAWNGT